MMKSLKILLTMKNNFNKYFELSLDRIENSLVKDAMAYSLFSNGKRLRSKILLEMVKAYGLDMMYGYDSAIALEMIHTYSLIHDDLPAMDDDDLRRGIKTCHKQFDEATAILAGDALLTYSFNILSNSALKDAVKIKLINLFSDFAGANGMILGQCLDMNGNIEQNKEYLEYMHKNKTGKLFALCFMSAGIISENEQDLKLLEQIGYTLGLAFQYQDDLLELTQTTEQLGKSTNSDETNHKLTINHFYDIDQINDLMNLCYNNCVESLKELNININTIIEIILEIKNRTR